MVQPWREVVIVALRRSGGMGISLTPPEAGKPGGKRVFGLIRRSPPQAGGMRWDLMRWDMCLHL